MISQIPDSSIFTFTMGLLLSLAIGYIIGVEREQRGKSAGIATQCLVIGGAMIFSFLSGYINPGAPTQLAAGIVTGVGFLGAGIIMKEKGEKIVNLTTAATIWYAAAIGMAIGYGQYYLAVIAAIFEIIAVSLPHIHLGKKRLQE